VRLTSDRGPRFVRCRSLSFGNDYSPKPSQSSIFGAPYYGNYLKSLALPRGTRQPNEINNLTESGTSNRSMGFHSFLHEVSHWRSIVMNRDAEFTTSERRQLQEHGGALRRARRGRDRRPHGHFHTLTMLFVVNKYPVPEGPTPSRRPCRPSPPLPSPLGGRVRVGVPQCGGAAPNPRRPRCRVPADRGPPPARGRCGSDAASRPHAAPHGSVSIPRQCRE